MYVCVCNSINEKQIKSIVDKSAIHSVAQLKKECNLGIGCGMCGKHASEVIKSCKKQHD